MRIIVIDRSNRVISRIHNLLRTLPFQRYDKTHRLELYGYNSGKTALKQIISNYQKEILCDLIISAQDIGGFTCMELGKELLAVGIAPQLPIILYVENPENFLKGKSAGNEITHCCEPLTSSEYFQNVMEKLCAVLISREVDSRIEKVDDLMDKQGTEDFIATLENYYMHAARDISTYKAYAPWSELPYKSLADVYIGSNKHKEAIPYLKAIIKINFHNHEAHKNLALCYRKIGKSFEELEELKATLSEFPHSSSTLLKIGEAMLRERDYENAAKYFKKAIANHKPEDTYRMKAKYHVGLGKAYMVEGDKNNNSTKHKNAKDEFNIALTIDPMLLAAYNNLIIVYYKLGMVKEAENAMAKAVKLLPDDADGWLNLFEIYIRDGEDRKAKYALRKVISSEPDNQIILCTAAEIYMRQNLLADAIELFKKALKINPSDIRIYNFMGICFRQLGEHKKAVSHYHKALQIDPGDSKIHYNLGNAYWIARKTVLAKKSFETALQLNPEFYETKNALRMIADHPDPNEDRRACIR